jgi:hypothetical protein
MKLVIIVVMFVAHDATTQCNTIITAIVIIITNVSIFSRRLSLHKVRIFFIKKTLDPRSSQSPIRHYASQKRRDVW